MNSIDHGGHRDRADHEYLCPLWSYNLELSGVRFRVSGRMTRNAKLES